MAWRHLDGMSVYDQSLHHAEFSPTLKYISLSSAYIFIYKLWLSESKY